MIRWDKDVMIVMVSALLTLASVSIFCCPAAQAKQSGVPRASQTSSTAMPANGGESDLDDDRAEHWALPGIAREGRVQSVALALGLAGAAAAGRRRRAALRRQTRND